MRSEFHLNALSTRPFFSLKKEITLGKYDMENAKIQDCIKDIILIIFHFVQTRSKILEEFKSTLFSLKYLNFRKQILKYSRNFNFISRNEISKSGLNRKVHIKSHRVTGVRGSIFHSCREQRSIHSTSRSFQDGNRSQHNP